jgi:hypothetical protein
MRNGSVIRYTRHYSLPWVLILVAISSVAAPKAPTNGTLPNVRVDTKGEISSTIHEAWFFYLSSLALTITAGSTLLVALTVIKLQSISGAFATIERALAEAFHKAGRLDDYIQATSEHFLNDQWTEYFDAVESLAKQHGSLFSSHGLRYAETKSFVDSLVAQGRKLNRRNGQLQSAMLPTFIATAALAGVSILGLPAVQWISPTILLLTWAITGFIALVLLVFFLCVVNSAFRTK